MKKLLSNPRVLLSAGVGGAAVGVLFVASVGALHPAAPHLFVGGLAAGLCFAVLCLARVRP